MVDSSADKKADSWVVLLVPLKAEAMAAYWAEKMVLGEAGKSVASMTVQLGEMMVEC